VRGRGVARLSVTAVAVARATRAHPKLKKGCSIRGAIATVAIAEELAAEGRDGGLALFETAKGGSGGAAAGTAAGAAADSGAVAHDDDALRLLKLAAGAALPTRIELSGDADASVDAVIAEICGAVAVDADAAVAAFEAASAEAQAKKG
jgi:hypothetical protein